MVYTITLNPAIDYIAHVHNLQIGKTNRTTKELFHAGGKGINVAIVLNRLGIDTKAIAFVGGFTGNALVEMLQQENLPLEAICCKGNTRINFKLKEQVETEINGQGVAIAQAELAKLYSILQNLQANDWLVLSGSIPKGMPNTLYADILAKLQEKNIQFVVDATGDLLYKTLPYKPFCIKPNVQELEELFKIKIESKQQIIQYAKKLQELGAKNVIVSMGGDGALLVAENGKVIACNSPKGEVIDTVGAGDSMVAGFIAGYMQYKNYALALQFAVATGSATAFSIWLAKKEKILQLFKIVQEVKYENC